MRIVMSLREAREALVYNNEEEVKGVKDGKSRSLKTYQEAQFFFLKNVEREGIMIRQRKVIISHPKIKRNNNARIL